MGSQIHLFIGWMGMLMGVLSGAVIGMFFARESWMGGYASFRRRLTRLGHIAFLGIGFLNIMYAVTHSSLNLSPTKGVPW